MYVNCNRIGACRFVAMGVLIVAAVRAGAGPLQASACQKVVLAGEVSAGQEWRSALGGGWVFRVLPIKPGQPGYSGWDLVMDREQGAGFPDALLLATPPFNSINEREVGTTFGLRAQDAIGWNPRSFRFISNAAAFREMQKLYLSLSRGGQLKLAAGNASGGNIQAQATRRLMELERQSSAGEFHIVDARLAPGIGDAAAYAQNWAQALPKTLHQFEPGASGKSTPRGELHWIRFSVTLWLPGTWKAPADLHAVRTACSE